MECLGAIFTHSKQYRHTSLADLSCIITLIPAFTGETKAPNLEPGDDEEMLYNNDVEDINFDTELLSWLYRVAVKVHDDIMSAPGHNCIGNINEKSAEEVVPESLFMLIAMLCAGDNDNEEGTNVEMKMRVLSICQDIVFLASRGRELTPKHVGLGLAVHQATRSKQLLHLLHLAGHSISYETVLRMDNTIAKMFSKSTTKMEMFLFLGTSMETQSQATPVMLWTALVSMKRRSVVWVHSMQRNTLLKDVWKMVSRRLMFR